LTDLLAVSLLKLLLRGQHIKLARFNNTNGRNFSSVVPKYRYNLSHVTIFLKKVPHFCSYSMN